MGMALGAKKRSEALYYLIPISAYLMGAFASELLQHFEMLIFFLVGSIVGTVLCNLLVGKAIWATLIPLGVIYGKRLCFHKIPPFFSYKKSI